MDANGARALARRIAEEQLRREAEAAEKALHAAALDRAAPDGELTADDPVVDVDAA